MKQIPRMQSEDREVNQLQNYILNVVNPVFKANPILFGSTLTNVNLNVGSTTINTGLEYAVQGWMIIRKRGPASIYDAQDTNPTPTKTLILISDTAVSVDLQVW